MRFGKGVVRTLLLLVLSLWATLSHADFRTPDAVLDGLIAEARKRNPEIVAAQAEVEAAEARPRAAGALADPMVGVVYTNDGWAPSLGSEDMTTLALMGSQALPYPGKRGLRRDLATIDAAVAALGLERATLSLTAAVSRAYYALTLARQQGALADEQQAIFVQIEAAARAAYAAGPGTQLDVLRAQIGATRVEEARASSRGEEQVRLAELNALLARPADTPVPTPRDISIENVPENADLADAERRSPELKSALQAVRREEVAVSLARRDFKPDFEVQAAYMNRGGLPPMWQAGVTVSVPRTRVRQRAQLAEAEARLRAMQARVESVRLRLRARTGERLARLQTGRDIERVYRDALVPQRRVVVESALATYRAGMGAQSDVLGALSALVEDRSGHLEVLARLAFGQTALAEMALDGDPAGMSRGQGAGASAGMGEKR